MLLKACLHLHAREDYREGPAIEHSLADAVRYAAGRGFNVIAHTGHEKYYWPEAAADLAHELGVLLIPGIELALAKPWLGWSDVLILNCGRDAEAVQTWADLHAYRRSHPDALIIAPHPGYFPLMSMGEGNFIRHADVFDAVEHSWLYSSVYNPNRRFVRLAQRLGKPVVATADVHYLDYLETDYTLIDCKEKSVEAAIGAIKAGRVKNVTRPKNTVRMLYRQARFELKQLWRQSAIRRQRRIIYDELPKNRTGIGFERKGL